LFDRLNGGGQAKSFHHQVHTRPRAAPFPKINVGASWQKQGRISLFLSFAFLGELGEPRSGFVVK
jgi:hypothetical protein